MAIGLLWLLFSLPIITIGAASISAAQYCLKLYKNEEEYLIRSFTHSFRDNIKQGIQIWIPMLIFMLIFGVDFLYYGKVFLILLSICLVTNSYLIFIVAKFENTVKGHIQMASVLIFRNIPCAIVILLMDIALIILTLLSDFLLLIPLAGITIFLQAAIFDLLFSAQLKKGGITLNE